MNIFIKAIEFHNWCSWVGMEKFLEYLLVIHILCKGWVCLVCQSHLDAERILERAWIWGSSSLVLKYWHPAFNP